MAGPSRLIAYNVKSRTAKIRDDGRNRGMAVHICADIGRVWIGTDRHRGVGGRCIGARPLDVVHLDRQVGWDGNVSIDGL